MTLSEERDLVRRHYLLLQTGQAALGLIGPEVLGIAVEARPDDVIVHVAVASHSEDVAEDLRELATSLRGYLDSGPECLTDIGTVVHVGAAGLDWSGRSHDLLYVAKRSGVDES